MWECIPNRTQSVSERINRYFINAFIILIIGRRLLVEYVINTDELLLLI